MDHIGLNLEAILPGEKEREISIGNFVGNDQWGEEWLSWIFDWGGKPSLDQLVHIVGIAP